MLAYLAVYQARFLYDLYLDFTFQYTSPAFGLGDPWPTVATWADPEAKAAGLNIGDRLTSFDNHPVNGLSDQYRAIRSRNPGDLVPFTAERNGVPISGEMRLRSVRSNRISLLVYAFALVMYVLMPLLSISLGITVAMLKPRDPMAWLLLLLLVSFSTSVNGNVSPYGWNALLRLPALLNQALFTLWPLCMLLFGIYFPFRSKLDTAYPWIKWLISMPIAAYFVLTALRNIGMSEAYAAFRPVIELQSRFAGPNRIAGMAAVSLFFATLAAKRYDPETSPDARRRIRLISIGSTFSLTPLLILLIYSMKYGFQDNLWTALAIMATFLFPVTLAYVIVVHRAMDVRVAIRQGLQYALVRRGARFIQALLSALVIFTVAYLASRPGTHYVNALIAVGIGFIVVLGFRALAQELGIWIDRRFFREAYNTDLLLTEIGESARGAVETGSLIKTVTDRVAETLHVSRAAVFLQNGNGFAPAYATGGSPSLDQLAEIAPPVATITPDHKPISFASQENWEHSSAVSESDRRTLAQLGTQLLLPLPARDRVMGLIALGDKKSEEPYSPTDVRLLQSIAAQTGLALENSELAATVAKEMAQRQMLDREIEIAREVQQRLFPQTMPVVQGLEYFGTCRPARAVGGDYYDFLELPQGQFGLAIGDISGKGVPAALLMASLQASLRGQTMRGSDDIAHVMGVINRLIYDASPSNKYATFFYSQYAPDTRQLTYVNGGHNPPVILRGSRVILLEDGGPVVGLFRPAKYQQSVITLEPDDLLVLFTDGISEAMNAADEEWGEEALTAAAQQYRHLAVTEIVTKLMADADAFANGAPQHDDMTIVVVKICA